MVGTEIVKYRASTTPVFVDPRKKNDYSVFKKRLDSPRASNRAFAGEQVKLNGRDGDWNIGFGDSAKAVKDTRKFVANTNNYMDAWQYWPDGEGPSYPHVVCPGTGGVLCHRAECGPPEEKYDKLKKKEMDVWKQVGVLVLRDPKTNDLFHYIATSVPGFDAVLGLCKDTYEEWAEKGNLPVITLGTERVKMKDGEVFMKPVFVVTGFAKSTEMDAPNGMAANSDADVAEDDDEPEVEAEDEDQDEPTPAPKKGKATAKPAQPVVIKGGKYARRTVLDADDEDETAEPDTAEAEDDEDEVVVIKKKKRLN